MKKFKLFCLPYAGGSSNVIYSAWKRHLSNNIQVIPVEVAGRGSRFGVPVYSSMKEAVDDIFQQVKKEISENNEYAIFGHSMGSILAYELSHKIIEEKIKKPAHVFFSGRQAPDFPVERKIHKLPDTHFKDEILKMNATPKEVFDNEELANIYIPILRSDYRLVEEYNYKERNHKFDFDISILNGKYDSIKDYEISHWKNHTKMKSHIHNFDGGHFFIKEKITEVADVINKTLGGKNG